MASKTISMKRKATESSGDFLNRLKLGSVKYRVRLVAKLVKEHDYESAGSEEYDLWEQVLSEVASFKADDATEDELLEAVKRFDHVAELAREALKTKEISFNRMASL